MKNAHERFGFAEFEKRLKDTTTRIRLTADCFIGEPANKSAVAQGHLLSVFGTDVEVAASGLPSSAKNAFVSAAPT
jgi:hypothetical protein